jgi:hypothetical protein
MRRGTKAICGARISTCLPAAYWRFAPIGGCLYKKQLDLFVPFASICFKRNLNAIAIEYFVRHYSIVDEKRK